MRRIPALVLSLVMAAAAQAEIDPRRDTLRHELVRPDEALVQLYWSLSDLSLEDQREQTWGLSSKTKAALWTFNIERYLREHPELSVEAQGLLREGIRMVNMPAWLDIVPGAFGYDLKVSTLNDFKARLQMLPPQMVHEVFIRLGPEPQAIEPAPQKPTASGSNRPSVPRVDKNACYCSSGWECLSSASFSCWPSWCEWVIHCGVFNNEACTGVCKEEDPL